MLILFALLSTTSFAAPSAEPSDPAKAIYLAQEAYKELDRSQNSALRRESERSACNLIGRLFALYNSHDEKMPVTMEKSGPNNTTVTTISQVPVPRFTNANIDAITLCRPRSLWERIDSMSALFSEFTRLKN